MDFRSGKRRPELKPDAVPNKFLKLTVLNLDEEDNPTINSSIVNSDHDYGQNQDNTSTINNVNSAQSNPTINSSIVNPDHDYGQNQVNKFEERFRALHEETVYVDPYEDPIGTFAALLEIEFPEIAADIINV